MDEQGQRQAVIKEALSWVGTPYHHMARKKGVGCDCLTFLAEVYERAGIIPHVDIPQYSNQWHLHRTQERYQNGVSEYCVETTERLPGNIIMWKIGRVFSHAGIIVDYPIIVHSLIKVGVQKMDIEKPNGILLTKDNVRRPVKYFDFWGGA